MTINEAICYLRNDPQYASLIRDSYLDANVLECAERFEASAEFMEVQALLGPQLRGAKILDLGAGNGIASYALAKCGAKVVYALEPDPSDEIGRGAIRRIGTGLPIKLVNAMGESIPLRDGELDVIYGRQVLHHSRDLFQVMRECARTLRSGGVILACREHVAESREELKVFLDNHPVHKLAGGENAYPLKTYTAAIRSSGLSLKRVLGPWDTVINAFPAIRTQTELEHYLRARLRKRLGGVGDLVSYLPGVNWLVKARLNRYTIPGRLYSFLATKL